MGFEPTCPAKDKTISNRSRYDHFDTSPYYSVILPHTFSFCKIYSYFFSKILYFSMKIRIILFALCVILLSPTISGDIGSKGLILEDGKTIIELQKGDKIRITVRDGFTKRIRQKGLTFFSKNKTIASIEKHSGILHANGIGHTQIYVVDEDGDAGTIKIKVTGVKEKVHPAILFVVLLAMIGITIIIKRL